MGFVEDRAEMVDAIFDELGEPATWNGSGPVLIRRGARDDDLDADRLSVIVRVAWLRVRKSEVPLPAKGDMIVMVDADLNPTGESFRISGDAQLSRNIVWMMPVVSL
jgi:hypothetical protein